MLSHKNILSDTIASDKNATKLYSTDVHLCYLPLPHVLERIVCWAAISVGATICFYGGNV